MELQPGLLAHSLYVLIIIIGGSVCTALLAYWGVWKKIIEPQLLKREEEKKKKIKEMETVMINQELFFSHINEMSQKLNEISAELKPNGGSSLKDIAVKTYDKVKFILSERDSEFQLSGNAMFRCDSEGKCIGANKALTDLFGASEHQLLGYGWANFIAESDRERIMSEWDNTIEAGSEVSSNYVIKNPLTEQNVSVSYRAIINRDNMNNIISILGLVEKGKKSKQ